jgi:hypothetical protein
VTDANRRETIIEFRVSGQFGQVCAIDVATGVEVSVTVPANTSKQDRESVALRKLSKALTESDAALTLSPTQKKGDNPTGSSPSSKRGIIV